MNLILKMAITLGIITSVAGFSLGIIYSVTQDRIAAAESAKTIEGLAQVLPGFTVDPDDVRRAEEVDYWVGQREDGAKGYAFIAKKNGYSSEIQTMVGIDESGKILGISVLFQQETPGLGARVQEVASSVYLWQWLTRQLPNEPQETKPWFAEQFEGLSATKPIAVRKGNEWQSMSEEERRQLREENAVSALSGATITTRTISSSIEEAVGKVLHAEGLGKG